MKQRYPLIVTSVVLALVVGPAPLHAEPDAERIAAMDQDDLSLFLNADELVETASRYPKPLNQVAENVTVITSEEIEAQHAHDLGEVLSQIPGLFINGTGQDVGSNFNILTQGSSVRHTLVLIDGVRLNTPSDGRAILNGLPVGIVKRIEIIQGPVSSSWGSSLGGVINIITKDGGKEERPSGQATASVGEQGTSEVNAQAGGRLGALGYYLYGGKQESDGHVQGKWFDNHPLYAKLTLPLSHLTMGATIGYSDPYGKNFLHESWDPDATEFLGRRATFSTAYLDAPLGNEFNFHLAASRYDMNSVKDYKHFGLDPAIPAGSFYGDETSEDRSDTLDGRLSWNGTHASGVIGLESGRGRMDFTMRYPGWGPVYNTGSTALVERRACYTNATLTWGQLSLSPGLRYDYNSMSDEALSPSLGATYRLTTETILRATLARGFAAPFLDELINSSYGNPNLAPEYVDSAQAGVETVAVPYLRLSATLFHHRVTDVWATNDAGQVENRGVERRKGVEFQADTKPWHRFTLGAKAALVSTDSAIQDNDHMYAANLIARYDDPELLSLRLGGRYVWWDEANRGADGKFDDFIWDLTASREVYTSPGLRAELFGVVRNLFNSSQYTISSYANPDRWLEAGLTVKY